MWVSVGDCGDRTIGPGAFCLMSGDFLIVGGPRLDGRISEPGSASANTSVQLLAGHVERSGNVKNFHVTRLDPACKPPLLYLERTFLDRISDGCEPPIRHQIHASFLSLEVE